MIRSSRWHIYIMGTRASLEKRELRRKVLRTPAMLDLLFIAIGLGFFAAGGLYLYACDRL